MKSLFQSDQRAAYGSSLFLRGHSAFITNLDILKSIAMILMVIDHIGVFFFPDQPLWRAIGRACIPLWFGLAGYASPKNIGDKRLIIGGTIVGIGYLLLVGRLLPLNALFTILAIHIQTYLLMDIRSIWERWTRTTRLCALGLYSAVLMTLIPVLHVWEYGSTALLLGLLGFLKKHPALLQPMDRWIYSGLIGLVTIMTQLHYYEFQGIAAVVCVLGMGAALLLLSRVPVDTVHPGHSSLLLRLLGRYTLEFYVIHLLLCMLLYNYLHKASLL